MIFLFSYTTYSQTAEEYFNSGLEKMKNGDFSDAIEDYTKAIELDPNYADAYINRGIAKNKLENHSGAITDFTKAIELDPNYDYH